MLCPEYAGGTQERFLPGFRTEGRRFFELCFGIADFFPFRNGIFTEQNNVRVTAGIRKEQGGFSALFYVTEDKAARRIPRRRASENATETEKEKRCGERANPGAEKAAEDEAEGRKDEGAGAKRRGV